MDIIEIIGHLSFIAIAASFSIRDIIWLRGISVFASSLAIIFNYYVDGGPIWIVIWWSVVFISINIYNITVILMERRGVDFSPEEKEMYETVFQNFSPVEFMKLIRISSWKNVANNQVLIEEGQDVREVSFIYNGKVDVFSKGKKVNSMEDGAFIGEMEMGKDALAVATIKTTTPVKIVNWSASELQQLLFRNPTMNSTIQGIFGTELVDKLNRQTSSIVNKK